MANETSGGQDPVDEYDRAHGAPGPDHAPISQDDAFGEKLNPVRDTENVATNLRDGGGTG